MKMARFLEIVLLLGSTSLVHATSKPGEDISSCATFVDDYVYQTAPAAPSPRDAAPSPLETKYSALLNKTCAAALSHVPVLPAKDAANFMKAYVNYTGYNSEADVIKYARPLLSNKDVLAFLARPESFGTGGLDADLVLCAVLTEATPANLANYSGQGKAQEALVDNLLANTMLMRDMLVAGGATKGSRGGSPGAPAMYGQAAAIYAKITKASAVLSSASAGLRAGTPPTPTWWDDRSQAKASVLHRAAIATAVEHAVPINFKFKESSTPPWGPRTGPNGAKTIDPVARYMHYEEAYLAGDLDPAFEATTAFEMRHTLNAVAVNADLEWMRRTMGIYAPDSIAMNYSVGHSWRYAETVHHDINYLHTHCPQPGYTAVCDGHYSQIPALGGVCGFRAFWGRASRQAFGLPAWGATHSGHAAMTSWNPQGWVIMLAGPHWEKGRWGRQSGLDFHLDVLARELRPAYQQFLRGSWAANAHGDAPVNTNWGCDWGKAHTCSGFGVGGVWNALMLYQKKATVAAAVFKNGTSSIPPRPVGPSTVPTKVAALIAKWNTPPTPPPQITTDAEGTIHIPAIAYATASTKADVSVMHSYAEDDGMQLLYTQGNFYHPDDYPLEYQFTAESAGTYYLSANHTTWHTDQDLVLAVNGKKVGNVPVYYTIGYWNETQSVTVDLAKGANTLTFTRLSTDRLVFKEFLLYKKKPAIPAPPGGGFTPRPIVPPLPASSFILEPSTTACVLQGLENVPEELCLNACKYAANRTYTGARKKFTNVKGCFAILSGEYKGNCNFNSNLKVNCTPPCFTYPGPQKAPAGELCLTKSMLKRLQSP